MTARRGVMWSIASLLCISLLLVVTWSEDGPGLGLATAVETRRDLGRSEGAPESAREAARESPFVRSVHVTSGRDGTDVAGAVLVGGTPLAAIATTDGSGVALVGETAASKLYVWHPEYQLATVDTPTLPQSTTCRLAPRPMVACVMDETDYSVISAHSFTMSLESRRSSLCADLFRVVGSAVIPVQEWSGFGRCEMPSFDAEECHVTVVARSVTNGSKSVWTMTLRSLGSYTVVPVRFSPPLSSSAVGVKIRALLDHPDDRDIIVKVTGPIEPDSGQPIKGFGVEFEVDGMSNHVVTKSVTLAPGVYSWAVTIVGLGTFPVGRFAASVDGEDIDIRGRLEFVTGTIGVHGVDRTVDLRAMRGLDTVSGEVLEKHDAKGGHAEWSYCLPKGSVLYAIAIVRDPWEISAPVRIPTDHDGGYVAIRGYAPSETVMLRIEAQSVGPSLRCLEVRDEVSGMIRTTRASAEQEFGPMRLTHGDYSARVREGSRIGEWLAFRVPGRNPVVLVD